MTDRTSHQAPALPAPAVPPAALDAWEEQRFASARQELVTHFIGEGEQERRRMAEGIHDDSIQVIAAMGMRLQLLRRTLRDPDQLGMLADAELAVQISISRLRHLVFNLHPPGLEGEGLSVALAIALDMAARDSAATYVLDDRLTGRPDPEVGVNLFRIAQQALENVRDHAQATKVTVTLEERDGGYALRVADDGCGFDPALAAAGSGFASMRARAALSGGSVRVEVAERGGTAVEAWLPRPPKRARTAGPA